ncbi:MAG: hypothetical protein WCC87_20290 [Candidatus Korobacteraceae bacterium]
MISILHYLYRKSGRQAMAALLAATLLGFGMSSTAQVLQDHTRHQQTPPPDQNHGPAKNAKRGARAIGVVEFLPGGGTRLVPIAIWIDDRFYDASLYAANPEPLAVEPQTVYQATDYGEPTGLFTVTTPKEVNGNWIADGRWTPHLALDEKLAQRAAQQPKKKATVNPDDDRPVLHRAGSSGSSGSGNSSTNTGAASGSSGNTPPPSTDDPDRPTLKNSSPNASTPASAAPASGPTQAGNPSKPTSPAATSSSPAASADDTNENDPSRPTLRRGKPAAEPDQPEPAQTSAAKSAAVKGAAQVKPVSAVAGPGRHSYPAVSDAGKYEMRSLLYAMGSSERVDRSQEMSALALDDIRKFIAQRKTPALPKAATITDYDLRGFDLDYTNSPTLVFTATLPVAGTKALRGGDFNYYVTVVAREDINGAPIKIFSSVTDSNHLDAFSRMEIIDAVDADANGRGDLLFRQYSDTGISYGLYRVYPYQMQKIFEGGSGI